MCFVCRIYHFFLISSYITHKSFKISVITDTNVKGLLTFKQVQQIESNESKFSSFPCMIVIFCIAVSCVIIGSYWSGESRFELYQAAVQKSQKSALVRKGNDCYIIDFKSDLIWFYLQYNL